jgi:N-acetylmuramoyl-L-alanine amidase
MVRIHKAGFESRDNGVRSAPFYVLMGARMPAVLVEIGYCTNADDVRRIKNDRYLLRLAEGIAAGVAGYKEKITQFAR